jgi:hypothetical protein
MGISLSHALSEIRSNFSSVEWWRNRVFVPYVIGPLTRIHPRYPGYDEAVSVMDEDWDTLIVLDACRADYFETVIDTDRFDEYAARVSAGSHSSEWTRRNFEGGTFGDTVYVSANPHTSMIAGDAFHHVEELWETDFDDEAGVVMPDTVRDAAIDVHERFPNKRLIVHFMQPHEPFVGSDDDNYRRSNEAFWDAYQDTIEFVMPYVEDVAEAVPGKTVITADHGELYATGIARLLGLDGHKARLRYPGLVCVPWATIDGQRREIEAGTTAEAPGENVQDRLEKLGYI